MRLRYYDAQALIARCSAEHDNMPSRIIAISQGRTDSELAVELRYVCPDGAGCYVTDTNGHEHGAVYGLLNGTSSLWQD